MHIVLFMPDFGGGGVERNLVYLANGLSQSGHTVSLLAPGGHQPFMEQLAGTVNRIVLSSRDDADRVSGLQQFIETCQPDWVLTGQLNDHRLAALTRQRLGNRSTCRFVAFVGTPLLHMIEQRHRLPLTRWLRRRAVVRSLGDHPRFIANARGVAADLARLTGQPVSDIAVVPNPAIPPNLDELSQQPVTHPWLQTRDIPVVMGIGRLSRAKDFPTLLRAFARVRQARPARLIILGSGRQKAKLEKLAATLNIQPDVDFPGFVGNPYAWLARAAVFALSSRWEGCPNVLIEALAAGTPVVATDCISGPAEILQDGRYGPLVPVGDDPALGQAILNTLQDPLPPDLLREAALPYRIAAATQAFIRILDASPA